MVSKKAPTTSAAPARTPALWKWQGVAGGLRSRPALAIALALSCVLIIGLVGYFVVLPEVAAQSAWRQAESASAQGDFLKARVHLESCVQVWQRSGATHFALARACRRAGDFDKARTHLDLSRQLAWPAGAIEFESLLMQVQEFGPSGADESTLQHYVYSNKHPEERLILEALVKGYMHTLFLGSASQWLNYWIEMHPDDWQPYLWRGQLQERLKRDDEACLDYRRVLELSPGQSEATLRLAAVLQRKGIDYDEATQLFGAFLAKHPDAPPALLGLARCQRGQQNDAGARATLAQLLTAHPDMVQGHQFAALLESDAEDYPRALEHLRKAEAEKPNEPDVVYQLSIVLRRLGKEAEADRYHQRHQQFQKDLEELSKVTRSVIEKPSDIDNRYEAGRILLAVGEEEGLRWLLTVLQVEPNHRKTHLTLAEYYEKSTEPEMLKRAKEHRRRAGLEPVP